MAEWGREQAGFMMDAANAIVSGDMAWMQVAYRAAVQAGVYVHLDSRLDRAVAEKDADRVRTLLCRGADPNSRSPMTTTLSRAVSNGSHEIVRLLLVAGANPELQSVYHGGALSEVRDLAMARIVVAAGANVNAVNNCGVSVLSTLFNSGVPVEVIRFLLESGADVKLRDKVGETVLMKQPWDDSIMSEEKAVETFRLLIAWGADVNAARYDGATPLSIASSASVAKVLIAAGAEVDEADKKGKTPLVYAGVEVAGVLVSVGADVCRVDNKGRTPLMHSVDSLAKLRLLLRAGADFGPCDKRDRSLLVHAVKHGSVECIKFLLDSGIRRGGFEAMLVAVQFSWSEVVDLLVAAGVSARTREARGVAALSVAAQYMARNNFF